jgi:hypothetical protein
MAGRTHCHIKFPKITLWNVWTCQTGMKPILAIQHPFKTLLHHL